MTRLWLWGVSIAVDTAVMDDIEYPVSFVWRGRRHRIEEVVNDWRVSGGVWHLRIDRDYFAVSTTTGFLVVVFYDWGRQGWYLERWYD